MLYTTRGILIHQLRYGDSSLIAKIYTEKFGVQSYMVKGVFKSRSRHPASLFQHLNLLELVAENREYGGLQHPREIRIEHPYMSLHTHPVKSTVCLFLNELLYRSLKHEEPDARLFHFVHDQLILFDTNSEISSQFHLWFMVQLTRFLGFFPQAPKNHQGFFDLIEGSFPEKPGPEVSTLNKEMTQAFLRLAESIDRNPEEIFTKREKRNAFLEQMLYYYKWHLEDFGDLQSHKILSELLSS